MNKILGILGVAVIAVAMFFSANTRNGFTSDTSLADLISISTANAEFPDSPSDAPDAKKKYKEASLQCSVLAYVKYQNGTKVGVSITAFEYSSEFTVEYKMVAGHQAMCVEGGNKLCEDIIGSWNDIFGNTGDCVPNS